MWPYGVQEGAKSGACTAASDVVGIHYVKDKGEYDCMAAIHANVTVGRPVCESRYCGPIDCNFTFPRSRKHTRCDRAPLPWSVISDSHSCEINSQGIERMFIAKRMRDLTCCQQLCLETCGCVAVDYYRVTAWCNLYDRACETPRKGTEGASSYRLEP